jgi:predicted nucleic acid-binding protein
MVYLQSLGNPSGVASRCLAFWSLGFVELWISRETLLEVGDVLTRPAVQSKFPLVTDDRAYELIQRLKTQASFLPNPTTALWLTRDRTISHTSTWPRRFKRITSSLGTIGTSAT